MPDHDRTGLTYRSERWRAVGNGILETASITFLLLIALRAFEAGATVKALIAGAASVGLLVSPLVVSVVARHHWPAARAAAGLCLISAIVFGLMSLWPNLIVFTAGSIIALAANTAAIPLITQIYQENYPARQRGHLFSRTVMIRIGTAALFSDLAGRALSGNMGQFQLLLVIFSLASLLAAFCLNRCPSTPLSKTGGTHPWRSLRFIQQDPVFRRTIICWMLMGFANLMMLPLRIEYLGNPVYGLGLTAAHIALFTGVIPNVARLLLSPVWGWLFDRMNFFTLRATLNLGFGIGIITFFTSDSIPGLVIGSVVYGLSSAGGDVAWALWVTKFAPAHQVADYMSVHTFFTGLRGFVAPLVGFHALHWISMSSLGVIALLLILVSTALLILERQRQPQH